MINLTILLVYVAASALLLKSHWGRDFDARPSQLGTVGTLFAIAGFLLHSYSIYDSVFGNGNANLNLSNVLSLIAWQVVLFATVSSVFVQLRGLAGLLIGIATVGLIATLQGSGQVAVDVSSWQVQSHILLSIFAYSILSIAACLGLCLAYQDRQFRLARSGGSLALLPPMETTERTFFSTVVAGFCLLSLAIFSGLVFVENFQAQHLTHKTVLSFGSWIVFGVLIFGRVQFGWRRKAVYWTLAAVILLGLAYFGTKFVLEVLLDKRWG